MASRCMRYVKAVSKRGESCDAQVHYELHTGGLSIEKTQE